MEERVSPVGKIIVASIIITTILSLDIRWGGAELPHKGHLTFSLQVGLLLVAFMVASTRKGVSRLSVVGNPMLLLWVSFFVFAAAGSMAHPYAWEIVKQVTLVLVPRVLLVFLVLNDRTPSDTFVLLARCFVVLMIGVLILGGIALSFGKNLIVTDANNLTYEVTALAFGPLSVEIPISHYNQFVRFAAPIGSSNPNTLGSLLLTSILFNAALLTTRAWRPLVGYGLLTIQLLALLGTLSRTSWLSLFAALVVLLVLLTNSIPRLFVRFSFLLLILGAMIPFLLREGAVVALAVDRTIDRGLTGRNEIWAAGLDGFRDHVFTGVGFGMSRPVLLEPIGHWGHLHSTYVQLLAETGLPGLVIFTGMIGFALGAAFYSLRILKQFVSKRQPGIGALDLTCSRIIAVGCASVVGFAVHSFAETVMFRFHVSGLLWTYVLATVSALVVRVQRFRRTRFSFHQDA